MKNILVTGGAGFIGSNFVHLAVKKGYNVVVIDALTYAANIKNLDAVKDNIKFVKGNICDKDLISKLLIENKIDAVFNFAAESHVDNSISSPSIFIQTNINGLYNMLEACRAYKKDNFRFIQVSTDEVYGSLELDEDKFTENNPLKPNSPYSASKAAGDLLARAWYETYKFPIIVTNCSNNYGPYQFPEKLIPKIILNALSNKTIPIYGNGKNIRDWIHVEDHANGVLLAYERGKIGNTYCFGGNAEQQNINIANKICDILNNITPGDNDYSNLIEFVEDRLGHDLRYAIDDSKAEKELGFKRKYDFESGLQNTVEWYLNNKDWF